MAGGLLALWGHGFYSVGIAALFKPIALELGFSRAATSVAASIGRFEGGLEAPLVGWFTDKFGPRRVVLLGVCVMSLGLILMNFINSLWEYYIVWGLIIGTGLNIALTLPWDTAISNWFVKKRGLALSIRSAFAGLSGVLIVPLIAWLITLQGWRMTCVTGGVVMAALGIPIAWFFLRRHRPEYYGLLPDGARAKEDPAGQAVAGQMIDRGVRYAAEVQEVEFTLRQALRTPAYWLLIVVNSVHSLVMQAVNIHGLPFLTDMGIDSVRAAGIMAIMFLSSVIARPVVGYLADRMGRNQLRFLLGGAYLLEAIGLAVFLLNQTLSMIYVWLIVYGFGYGAGLTLTTIPRARYFGRKAFGSIQGTSTMLMAPAAIVAPVYAGWMYDTTGSYIRVFAVFAVLLAFAALISPFARPPKPPAHITGVREIM